MIAASGNQAVLHAFLGEARERLAAVARKLDALRSRPGNSVLWNGVCRDFQAVTRGAAFFDMTAVLQVCKPVDTLIEELSEGKSTLSTQLQDMIAAATVAVLTMIEDVAHDREPTAEGALVAQLRSAVSELTGRQVSQ